jgi:hypothetical protein
MDTATRKTWEYRVEALDLDPTEIDFDNPDKLNELGAQGWELISVQPNPTAGAAPFLCFFKRPWK